MKATEKSSQIDDLLYGLTGRNRVESIANDQCNLCGGNAVEFIDETSKREYSISGLCQLCQIEIFNKEMY